MIGRLHPALAFHNRLELVGQMIFVRARGCVRIEKPIQQLVVLQPLFAKLLVLMVGLLTIIYMRLNDLFI